MNERNGNQVRDKDRKRKREIIKEEKTQRE